MPKMTRGFGETSFKPTVLVQLADPTAPASAPRPGDPPAEDPLTTIAALAGAKTRSVFEKRIQRRSALAQPATLGKIVETGRLDRFVEIPMETASKAATLAKLIREKLATKVDRVLPVPMAIPAIAPASAEDKDDDYPIPDFTSLQGYLRPAPDGFGFTAAWGYPGGDGAGVTVVDCEGGWELHHETLSSVRYNLWGGEVRNNPAWKQHGTAVVGILAGPFRGPGIVGGCPSARVGLCSVFTDAKKTEQRVANQILTTLEYLTPGDVLLVELQRPGPTADFAPAGSQLGYIPVSYWPDVRAAIEAVVQAGISVVEVGGNGGQDLDDPAFEGAFNQSVVDTGSIVVGAGAPPGGFFGPPRSRLEFSNYGSRVDCQAWGDSVLTTGYGDLWGGEQEERQFTARFMGTSSAGPMVAAVVACLQGRFKAVHGGHLPPETVRSALANIGSPQTDAEGRPASQRIGPQPDLEALFQTFELA